MYPHIATVFVNLELVFIEIKELIHIGILFRIVTDSLQHLQDSTDHIGTEFLEGAAHLAQRLIRLSFQPRLPELGNGVAVVVLGNDMGVVPKPKPPVYNLPSEASPPGLDDVPDILLGPRGWAAPATPASGGEGTLHTG